MMTVVAGIASSTAVEMVVVKIVVTPSNVTFVVIPSVTISITNASTWTSVLILSVSSKAEEDPCSSDKILPDWKVCSSFSECVALATCVTAART